MTFNLVCLILVLAITFMHSIFGFFSGLINVFCTIVSVCVSLGFYESLSGAVVKSLGVSPSYTEPVVLLLLFVITLSGLRFAADNLVRGNVHVPRWMDWTGAGVCGFINAQLVVGMIAISTLMLPVGGRVLQFQRYERSGEKEQTGVARFERNRLWFRSDEMTVGLFNLLSGGSLSSQEQFASVYPNYLDTVFFTTNTVQPESATAPYRDKSSDGVARGIAVKSWWYPKGEIEAGYREELPSLKNKMPPIRNQTYKSASGDKMLAVRIELDPSSADRNKSLKIHVFRPTQLRLVGRNGDTPAQYVARVIGGADKMTEGRNRLCDMDTNFAIDATGPIPIDAYFEVPDDFTPEFVEYRRLARAEITGEPAKSPPPPIRLIDTSTTAQQGGAAAGRTFASALDPEGGGTRRLPFALATAKLRSRGQDLKLDGETIAAVRVSGRRADLEPQAGEPEVRDLKVPAGQQIFQLRWKPREARSIVGQVFAFTDQLNQFTIDDDRGETYHMVGYYGIVRKPDREDFELFYNGAEGDKINPAYNMMLDFKSLKWKDVNDAENSTVGLIFFVKPGVRIMRVKCGTEVLEMGEGVPAGG